jgi:hypothetical protein
LPRYHMERGGRGGGGGFFLGVMVFFC